MSDLRTPATTRLGPIRAEGLSVSELLEMAATGPVVIERPYGADPIIVVATPAVGVTAVVAVAQALRAAADPAD